MSRRTALAFVVAMTLAWSCADPVHDARVDALGAESRGVSPGPTHRPGQPCLSCHGGDGPANVEFSVAGTIYQTAAADSSALEGATVTIFDATQLAEGGTPRQAATNQVGNFYVRKSDWSPTYPLHDISVSFPSVSTPTLMHTTVGRDGSCATCHFEPKGPGTHGHIYLVLELGDFPGAQP